MENLVPHDPRVMNAQDSLSWPVCKCPVCIQQHLSKCVTLSPKLSKPRNGKHP